MSQAGNETPTKEEVINEDATKEVTKIEETKNEETKEEVTKENETKEEIANKEITNEEISKKEETKEEENKKEETKEESKEGETKEESNEESKEEETKVESIEESKEGKTKEEENKEGSKEEETRKDENVTNEEVTKEETKEEDTKEEKTKEEEETPKKSIHPSKSPTLDISTPISSIYSVSPKTPKDFDVNSKEHLLELYKEAYLDRENMLERYSKLQRKLLTFYSLKKENTEYRQSPVSDTNERYNKYIREYRDLRNELNDVISKNEMQLMEMSTRLQERLENVAELRLAFAEFKKNAAMNAELQRTGKPLNPKVIEDLMRQESEKDEEVKNVRTRYIHEKHLKEAYDRAISAKEEFSKGLHLIDFEQHKIENSNLNEKFEEKSESLQKSRIKATQTVHILTHVKEKLQFVQSENADLQRVLANLELELNKHKDTLTQLKRERDVLNEENTKLKDKMPLIGNRHLMEDFENKKKRVAELQVELNELKAKHKGLVEKIQMYNALIHAKSKNGKLKNLQKLKKKLANVQNLED